MFLWLLLLLLLFHTMLCGTLYVHKIYSIQNTHAHTPIWHMYVYYIYRHYTYTLVLRRYETHIFSTSTAAKLVYDIYVMYPLCLETLLNYIYTASIIAEQYANRLQWNIVKCDSTMTWFVVREPNAFGIVFTEIICVRCTHSRSNAVISKVLKTAKRLHVEQYWCVKRYEWEQR